MVEDKHIKNLPPGWSIVEHDPGWDFSILGWCHWDIYSIEIFPPVWIPGWFGIRQYFIDAIIRHETLHAWGHQGCDAPYCLMFEDNESWREVLAYPDQLFHGFKLCKRCDEIWGSI